MAGALALGAADARQVRRRCSYP